MPTRGTYKPVAFTRDVQKEALYFLAHWNGVGISASHYAERFLLDTCRSHVDLSPERAYARAVLATP